MTIEQITSMLDNIDGLKQNPENFNRFVEYLKTLDLKYFDISLKNRIVNFLNSVAISKTSYEPMRPMTDSHETEKPEKNWFMGLVSGAIIIFLIGLYFLIQILFFSPAKGPNSWNGTYKSGKVEIQIYRVNLDTLGVFIAENKGTINSTSYFLHVKLNKNNELNYVNEFGLNTESMNIKKLKNGIEIKSASTEQDHLLKRISGIYTRENFKSLGWNGIYRNENYTIALSEVGKNKIVINTTEGERFITEYSSYSSSESLEFLLNESVSDVKITVTKSSAGIEIVTNDSDPSQKKLNGKYKKVKED